MKLLVGEWHRRCLPLSPGEARTLHDLVCRVADYFVKKIRGTFGVRVVPTAGNHAPLVMLCAWCADSDDPRHATATHGICASCIQKFEAGDAA